MIENLNTRSKQLRYSPAHMGALMDIESLVIILFKLDIMDDHQRRVTMLRLWGKGLTYYRESYL
jgi:hypothetical protein